MKFTIGWLKEHLDTKLKDNICKSCSRALKEFGNNIDTLQKAVLYLERNK